MVFWRSVVTAAAKPAARCRSNSSRATVTRAVACYGTSGLRRPPASSPSSSTSPTLRYARQSLETYPWIFSTTASTNSTAIRAFSAEPIVYEDPLPASEVDPNAAEDEQKIKELAAAGQWEEAHRILLNIRAKGMKPSMAASIEVVAVFRRALKWDEADECYGKMIEEHMPEDVFKAYAAPEPEDETKRISARSLAIAVMMQEDIDNIVPKDEETYRGLLLTMQDDGAWQGALLLAEQADRDGIVLENFSVNVLCCLMTSQGYPDVATMLYEKLIMERLDQLSDEVRLVSEEPWNPDHIAKNNLDLHNLTGSAAVATVRIALLDLYRKPKHRAVMNADKVIRIVTGLGNNSEGGEAVIKPLVIALLDSLKIKHNFQRNNEGCLEIEPAEIRAYLKRLCSPNGAALS